MMGSSVKLRVVAVRADTPGGISAAESIDENLVLDCHRRPAACARFKQWCCSLCRIVAAMDFSVVVVASANTLTAGKSGSAAGVGASLLNSGKGRQARRWSLTG
jgi:hypothetical protein